MTLEEQIREGRLIILETMSYASYGVGIMDMPLDHRKVAERTLLKLEELEKKYR